MASPAAAVRCAPFFQEHNIAGLLGQCQEVFCIPQGIHHILLTVTKQAVLRQSGSEGCLADRSLRAVEGRRA